MYKQVKKNIRKYLRKVIFHPILAKRMVRPILRMHNLSYRLAGTLSSILSDDGVHPKHEIL